MARKIKTVNQSALNIRSLRTSHRVTTDNNKSTGSNVKNEAVRPLNNKKRKNANVEDIKSKIVKENIGVENCKNALPRVTRCMVKNEYNVHSAKKVLSESKKINSKQDKLKKNHQAVQDSGKKYSKAIKVPDKFDHSNKKQLQQAVRNQNCILVSEKVTVLQADLLSENTPNCENRFLSDLTINNIRNSPLTEHGSSISTNSKKDIPKSKVKKQGLSKQKKGTVSKFQKGKKELAKCESKNNDETKVQQEMNDYKELGVCSSRYPALDDIISDVQNIALEQDKIKLLEQQIRSLDSPVKFDPILPQNGTPNRIYKKLKKAQVGLQIINVKNHGCLFSLKELEEIWDGMDVDNVNKMPFSSSLCLLFPYEAYRKRLPNKNLMFFVFRLLSLHSNNEVAFKCLTFLLDVVEISRTASHPVWLPSLRDIVEVLINYGFTVDENSPICEVFEAEDTRMLKLSPPKRKKTVFLIPEHDQHLKKLDMYNVSLVFLLVSELANMRLYEDETLVHLVLLLCWLLLDSQTERVQPQIQTSISSCLKAISNSGWESKWVKELSQRLCQLTERPEDILNICNFLLPVGRIQTLRKIVSLHVAHNCLNAPYSFKISTTPADVVSLLKLHPLTLLLKDAEFLEITLGHIDYAVGEDIDKSDMDSLKELSQIFRSTAGRISDSIHSPEDTQVKSVLLSLACKWNVLHQQFIQDSGSSWKRSSWAHTAVEVNNHYLQDSYEVEDSLPTPTKKSFSFSPRLYPQSRKAIPTYQTEPEEMGNDVVSGTRTSPRRSGTAKNIPSYKTKAHELLFNTEAQSLCTNAFSNSEDSDLTFQMISERT